ncbi:uncharacterized protein Dwil_GK25418 [Drosophila willistoni]|uniref:DUF243 domain-containing protein n=1 Tax=Drosophila willistoni TaxID=7260 RepID=B4NDS3_DROWI|nr:putative uncharacterized protein DDB_G0277255 [Drosophila willistoni]EDW81892.1 uncharacterized protein Dwil_GK25418 [Drosophila willistoni]
MRLFVTLSTLLALTAAKPQGYNYGSGVSGVLSGGHSGGFLTAPSNTQSVASYGPLGAFQSASVGSLVGQSGGSVSAPSHYGGFGGSSNTYSTSSGSGNGGFGASSNTYSTSSGGASGGNSGSFTGFGPTPNIGFGALSGYQAPSYQQEQQQEEQRGFQAPIIHKQFITISAPEEHENLERSKHLVIGRPQKNYRVVFIKAPSSSSANVKLSAEYAPNEEKTVIYVLSKKDSSLEVNDIATPAPTVPSKPEVFFIKYKTDAEAAHAQQQIQAEYDRIEGSSEHTNGGVAPAQSVVGILDGGAAAAASTHSSSSVVSSGSQILGSTGGSSDGYSSSSSGSTSGILGNQIIATQHKTVQSPTYLPPSGK